MGLIYNVFDFNSMPCWENLREALTRSSNFVKSKAIFIPSFFFFWEKRQIRNWAWKHTLLIENSHVEYYNLMTRVPFQFFWSLKFNKIVFIEEKTLLLTNRQKNLIVGKQKRKSFLNGKIFKKGFGFLGSDDLIFSPSGNNFPKNYFIFL